MKRVMPKNREQKRALTVANRIRKIFKLEEIKTIPVTKNPFQTMIDNKAIVDLNEMRIDDIEVGNKVAKELRENSFKSGNGDYVIISVPRSVAVFNINVYNNKYSNLT